MKMHETVPNQSVEQLKVIFWAIITLDWKYFRMTNALAYYTNLSIMTKILI